MGSGSFGGEVQARGTNLYLFGVHTYGVLEVYSYWTKDPPLQDFPKRDRTDRTDLGEEFEFIFAVFGRRQELGETPLETLPPSDRLLPDAPLTRPEINAVVLADMRWYGIKIVTPEHPIFRRVFSVPLELPLFGPFRPDGPEPGKKTDDER